MGRKNMHGPKRPECLWLIDADNWTHRLYHAIPQIVSPSGAPINAIVGFVRTLRKLREKVEPPPRWVVPIFDGASDGGWRRERFAGYKADRKPQDPELLGQWEPLRELLHAIGLPVVRVDGLEADDLIAAYTEVAVAAGLRVKICSSDKDLMQLVRTGAADVRCYQVFGKQAELRGPAWVRERFGVGPERLGDLLALAGDSSDGIPGCPGVGEKTAASLLEKHGDLDGVLADWSLVHPHKIGDALHEHADKIRLGRELVRFAAVELPVPLERLTPWAPRRSALDGFFRELGYPRFEAAIDRHEDES